jgi:glutaminyl-peptide cyclotransferase
MNMFSKYTLTALLPVALLVASCGGKDNTNNVDTTAQKPAAPRVAAPLFAYDSAYAHVKTQLAFGPRVPGSEAHAKCAEWMKNKLTTYGLTVTMQEAPISLPNGQPVRLKNVFASYKPERADRILLLAHWDSRAMADRDTARQNQPIDGANDGASGVAVLLEIARLLQEKDPNIGVDFLMVDAEDQGNNGSEQSWCLGAQYWATNKPANYKPRYGILLDMVGGQNPLFPREGNSYIHASHVQDKVWNAAAAMGYGNIFINEQTGPTTDDHLFINTIAGIPTIDIVHYDTNANDYFPHHHRHSDNLSAIDISTLKMVGAVVLDVVYNENPAAPVK